MAVKITDILKFLNSKDYSFEYIGNREFKVENFCAITDQIPNSITWPNNFKHFKFEDIKNPDSVIIVTHEKPNNCKEIYNVICTDMPKSVFFEIINEFFHSEIPDHGKPGVANTAIIETKVIGKNPSIGHNCYIGPDVILGDNALIGHNVIIDGNVTIGNNCHIDHGAIIGSSAYDSYSTSEESGALNYMVPNLGTIKIGDNVFIGALTIIVKGSIGDTIVGNNVKIDGNLYVAHNVKIGDGTHFIGGAGGNAILGKNVHLAGRVLPQVHVGDGAYIGATAIVREDVGVGDAVVESSGKIIKNGAKYIKNLKK